ncbi:MAG: hypothetical protein AMJ62_10530 [Myxococcales bacterium SG8_38]|nr:MAG: hypothetical protein AMJ62_10530 [Myxococcales bacterium SG8_38]
MKGIAITRTLVVGTVALALMLPACKTGKDTATAVEPARAQPAPSGTMSLQGMYSYMADAGLFVDCSTGERWPVAAELDNAALERAYLDARTEPGAPLLVTLEGRLEKRPEVDGRGKETMLIVERFVRVWPGETCQSASIVTLEDTYWAFLEIHGKPVPVGADGKKPYLELNSKKASAYGFGGCNRFFGSYRTAGQDLEFGALGATRMACPEGMDREQELFRMLGTVTRYAIDGSELLLFSGEKLVARLGARAMPE